ncbi:4-hydroxy-3-methylbut-2-enyl diphosphate reductase [Alphaproteobacteria bacterium]|nr:4-hydroxy-3-methylbut-2-enyl diphosphate reductase [Alphaproteobacteria bacterium]
MNQSTRPSLKIILAKPRGFCAGVERAIEIVERALKIYGSPIYVRHEIVHNKRVLDSLKSKGAIFVEDLNHVPIGSVAIFSAHGVSKVVESEAGKRELKIFDATCPLVTKVHIEGRKVVSKGYGLVLIGHLGHPEVEGTMGQISGEIFLVSSLEDIDKVKPLNPDKLAYITQTTLSVDDTKEIIDSLIRKFPKIVGPDIKNICYATQNRQLAVRSLAKIVDLVLVLGSKNSSNSNRLVEIAQSNGTPAYLVEDANSLNYDFLNDCTTLGITAGASAPEELISELVNSVGEKYNTHVTEHTLINEDISFKLPFELEKNIFSN